MALKIKKYPLLISTIVSCAIIVISLFILGFAGLNLGVSLGGGTQVEIVMENDKVVSDYKPSVKKVLRENGLSIDSNFVEDKFVADDENSKVTKKCLIFQIAETIDDEKAEEVKTSIASALGYDSDKVLVEKITSSFNSKSVLKIGLAFGAVALCMFVFAWIRYDIFAGISFIISFLHNIILYFSLIILTRVHLTLPAIAIITTLTLIMSIVLISIYERFRDVSKQQEFAKVPVQEKMISCEIDSVKPFVAVAGAVVILVLFLFFVPVRRVTLIALNALLALLVTGYTTLLIGPSSYIALYEIREMNRKAIMSRNDTVNKAIKKKIKNNAKSNVK